MNLKGIVSVSGKPGLFKAIAQNKSGFVLESLDEKKIKLVVNLSTSKLASLEDITVFGVNEDLKLQDIFESMDKSSSIPDPKADGNALRKFFLEVAAQHDEDKVYSSDIKKIISWFNIIKDQPFFKEAPVNANTEEVPDQSDSEALAADTVAEEPKAVEKTKKPKKAEK